MTLDNIGDKDLNLLLVFEALALERNVSRAASRLHLSQSAVSHALSRLRDSFGDDLFVRAPRGVVPTARANALQPLVLKALEAVRGVYRQGEEFTPAQATGQVRMGATEAFEHLVLPKLIARLADEAPNLVLNSRMVHGRLPKEEMEQGLCDVAVAGSSATFRKDSTNASYTKTASCAWSARAIPASRRRRPWINTWPSAIS